MMPRIPDRDPDLVVTVFGEPKTKGSVTAFIPKRGDGTLVTRADGQPMVVKHDDTGAKGKQWLTQVAQTVAVAMQNADVEMLPPKAPVVLEMVFYRPRPASHFGTGRNAEVLKDSAPAYPSTKPDVDKLERAILDGLKGVAWHDDGQVIGAPAWKDFGTPARVELRFWRLPSTVGELLDTGNRSLTAQSPLFASTSL